DTGDSRSAVACLKRLVQLDSENIAGWQNLAVAQFARDRFDEGIDACHRALEVDPKNLPTFYNLALAHEHLSDYDQALRWVREGLAIDPGDLSLQKLEFRIRALKFRTRVLQAIRTFLHLRLPAR